MELERQLGADDQREALARKITLLHDHLIRDDATRASIVNAGRSAADYAMHILAASPSAPTADNQREARHWCASRNHPCYCESVAARPSAPTDDGTTLSAALRAWGPGTDGTPAPWREGDCAGHEPDGHRTRWCYCRRNALHYPIFAARPSAPTVTTEQAKAAWMRAVDADDFVWRAYLRELGIEVTP